MRRMGKFYVNNALHEDHEFYKVLQSIEFVPYRVEFLGYDNSIEMIGTSPFFEPLEQGIEVPVYNLEVSFDEDEEGNSYYEGFNVTKR